MDGFVLDDPFDINTQAIDARTILYPEVHLCSPIVRNQLRLICHVADVDPGFYLRDNTILANYDIRQRSDPIRRGSPLLIAATRLKQLHANTLKSSQCRNSYAMHTRLIRANDHIIGDEAKRLWTATLNNMDTVSQKDSLYINMALRQLDHCDADRLELTWDHLRPIVTGARYRKSVDFWYVVRYWARSVQKGLSPGIRSINSYKELRGRSWNVHIASTWICLYNRLENWHCYLCPTQVLMYTDLVEGRWLADLGARLMPQIPFLHMRLEWLLVHFDSLFEVLQESMYELVEQVEALLTGAIQNFDDCVALRGNFLADTLANCRQALIDLGHRNDKWVDDLREFLTDITLETAAELFCTFRLWGHPPVEAGPAADKMKEYMNANACTTMEALLQNQRAFRVMIINGYISKNGGTWPNVQLDSRMAPRLSILRMTGKGIPIEQIEGLGDEIDLLEFEETFEIDLEEDYSIYFKDKAIAPEVNFWDSSYQWVGMRYKPRQYRGHRRLLSYFLDDKDFDPYSYLEYVESKAYLDDATVNISTSLKEREVKLDGRLFAKMTPKMRGGQVIAESLLSKHILPLLSENGMVRTEREIAQSLIKMNTTSMGEARTTDQFYTLAGFLTTDIKKYCQSQRFEMNALIAEDLNHLFGLKELFHWQHKLLLEHFVYVADPFCPPSNDQFVTIADLDDRIKVSHCAGGIEGLSQKLWSTISITIIRDVARLVGCKIMALVCGDNQVIAVTKRYPPSMSIHDARNDIANLTRKFQLELARRLIQNNQILKDRETVLSSNIMIFGKRILRNGRYLPQALKAITRMALWAETTVEETRSACSNLSTVIVKSLSQGLSPRVCHMMNALRTTEQILHGIHLTLNTGIEDLKNCGVLEVPAFLALMARMPAPLGGFCYLLRDRLFVRNIGDPLSVSFADLKGLLSAGFLTETLFRRIFNQKPGNGSWIQLGLDPYSGNIQSTQSMTTILERITTGSVLAASVNPLLRGLFHEYYREEDEEMARHLLDLPDPAPRWASAVLGLLPTGKRKKIAGFVETMKTTIRQACQRGGLTYDLKEKLQNYDRDQFLLFLGILMDKDADKEIIMTCAVTMATSFRTRCWWKLLGGRMLVGLETPPLTEGFSGRMLLDGERCDHCLTGNDKFVWAQITKGAEVMGSERPDRASLPPYMGGDTKERSQVALLRPHRPSGPVKEAIRLAMLVIWRFGDTDEAWELAHKLALTRTCVSLDILQAVVPSPAAANMHHRLDDGDTQISYFTGRDPRFTRHIRLSTDRMNELLPGVDDTNVVYQPVMLTCIAMIEDELRDIMRVPRTLTYHLHINTTCCVREMAQDKLSCPPEVIISDRILRLNVNPLIYDQRGMRFRSEDTVARIQGRERPRQYAERQPKDKLERQLGYCTGAYVAQGIIRSAKTRAIGDITDESDANIIVTGLISEMSASDPRCFMKALCASMLLDSASDLYFSRVFGIPGILAWWSSRLAISPNALWLSLKSVFNTRKVLTRWLEHKMFVPQGSPNLYNVVSIEAIKRWIFSTMRVLLTNPDQLADSIWIADSTYEVILQKKNVMLKNIWMLGALVGEPTKLRSFKDMEDSVVDLHAQFSARVDQDWKMAFPDDYDGNQLLGTLYYHARIFLSELRLREDDEVIVPNPETTIPALEPMIIYGDSSIQVKVVKAVDIIFKKDQGLCRSLETQVCKDYRHYILRTVGFNTTAHLKVVGIFKNWESTFSPKCGLFVAEGSGGIMSCAGLIWDSMSLYFNSLKLGVENDQRTDDYYPSEIFSLTQTARDSIKKRLTVLDGGTPLSTDLTNPHCINLLIEETPTLDLITCDIENHNHSVLRKVWKNLLTLCTMKLAPGGRILWKMSNKYESAWIYGISWIRLLFNNVTIHVSPMSSSHGRETYVEGIWPGSDNMDPVLTAYLASDYYPMNVVSPNEMNIQEELDRAFKVRADIQSKLVTATTKHPLVTMGGSICMSLGFKHNTSDMMQVVAPWFGDQNRTEYAIRHIMNEEKDDLRGHRLKAYGGDAEVRVRSELKEEFERLQITLMLNSDLRTNPLGSQDILEECFRTLDPRLKERIMKSVKDLKGLSNLTMKQVYKAWSGSDFHKVWIDQKDITDDDDSDDEMW